MAQDRIDLQRQAEKDTSLLSNRLKALERELEEQETKGLETEEQHKSHTEDLSQQVQALEKQLKNNRQFIEVRRRCQSDLSVLLTQPPNVVSPFCRNRPSSGNTKETTSSMRSAGWRLFSGRLLVWMAKDTG